jgi:hypothetical protein
LKCSEESWLEAFVKFEKSLNEDSDVSKIINNINYLKKVETNVEADVIKKRTSYNVVDNEQLNDFIAFANDDNENENSIDVMDYMVRNELNFWTENGLDFVKESNNFSVCFEKNLLEEEKIKMINNQNITFSTCDTKQYLENEDLEIVNDRFENLQIWRDEMKKLTIEEKISEENLNVHSISLSNINSVNNNENIGFINSLEASGEECIKKFSLNTEQETTFKLFTELKYANQRNVYCGVEGGTGKSQIINAIADFFE